MLHLVAAILSLLLLAGAFGDSMDTDDAASETADRNAEACPDLIDPDGQP